MLRRLGGDSYAQLLKDHHRIVRDALEAHEGTEQNTQGDSFFATFNSPSACIAAVIEVQRQLVEHKWPEGEQLKVRMGVHVGEVAEESTGLVGYEVHRAARIGAVAHGGQVLLSSATAGLVQDSLPSEVGLRELGAHRLKDLGRPEVLFQLVAEGLQSNFPPLRSLDNPELPNNLPASLSPFIGRIEELAEVTTLVGGSRLVTVAGSGGSGKTRLALQAAADLLDGSGEGVWFVDLAPIATGDDVPRAIAAALGIRQQVEGDPLDQLVKALILQDVLILLDNCEHVVEACAKIAEAVIRGCPKVHIVATSREPLGIEGERVYRIRSLSLPISDDVTAVDLEGSDAARLFVERARAHDDTFRVGDAAAPLVASICRRLDGVPLAIELAAARLSSMSLTLLNDRLDQRFRLLTKGNRNALPRQQTLQAMVDWSFDLLTNPEKVVLRRLSVFVGGFELEQAETVCSSNEIDEFEVADHLGSLVNKSLVVAERSSESLRYSLLETIRQYGSDQLARFGGEAETLEAHDRHAKCYLAVCEELGAVQFGPLQGKWMKRLDTEWPNVQAALAHLVDQPGRSSDVLRIFVALERFLLTREHLEPTRILTGVLEREDPVPESLLARGLFVAALLMTLIGLDHPEELSVAKRLGEEARDLADRLGDLVSSAEILSSLFFVAYLQRDAESVLRLAKESLQTARRSENSRVISLCLNATFFAEREGDPEAAKIRLHEALVLIREVGDITQLIDLLGLTAGEEVYSRNFAAACSLQRESLAAAEEIGADCVRSWGNLGVLLLLLGEFEEAEQSSRQALRANLRMGRSQFGSQFPIFVLACCATHRGDFVRAATLTGAHNKMDEAASAFAHWSPAEIATREGNDSHLRGALGVDEFERLQALGRSLSLNETINLALERTYVT